MIWTDDELGRAYSAVSALVRKAYSAAVYAERMLTSKGSDVDRRYWAGQVDACVAILKVAQPEVDWLADVRVAATLEDAR